MQYNFTNGKILEVGTMYCVGQNYAKHIAEMGGNKPTDPIIFIKPSTSYVPNNGKIIIPDISQMCHHEVELVVIIGQDAYKVTEEYAHTIIAGYAVGIDCTLRDIQAKAKKEGHPWAVAKGFYTSAPISSVIPIENFSEYYPNFELELKVNGETRQKSNTKYMERSIPTLIEYITSIFKLKAGDCIFTGTPEGVGQIQSGDKIKASLVNYIDLEVDVC